MQQQRQLESILNSSAVDNLKQVKKFENVSTFECTDGKVSFKFQLYFWRCS